MKLHRFLRETLVELDLHVAAPDWDDEEPPSQAAMRRHKEAILAQLVTLLDRSDQVVNSHRLLRDMVNRERKATTGIGHNIAIPHVRTQQVRSLVMAVAIVRDGVEFDAVDREPVHVFVTTVAPPYDDRLYLKIYRALGELALAVPDLCQRFLDADNPGEVIRLLDGELE